MLRILVAVFIFNFHLLVASGQDILPDIYPLNTSAPQIDSTKYLFSNPSEEGYGKYHRDNRIDELLELQKDMNKRKGGISGYKVQLFRGNSQKISKMRALEIQAMVYQKLGNETEVDVIFTTPYWRVQVGHFRMQNEAMKEEALYKKAFPDIADNISVVPAVIHLPVFKKKSSVEEYEGQ